MDFPLTSANFQFKYLGAALGFSFFFYLAGISPLLSGLLCVLIALVVSFSYSGIEISADYTKLRNYVNILSWRIGNWRPIPEIQGVTMKYFSALQRDTPANMTWGTWRTSSRRLEELVVMLSVRHSQQGIIIGRTDVHNYHQALAAAQQAATTLSVPLHTYLPARFSES